MTIKLKDGSSVEIDELFIESSVQSEALLNKIKSYSLKYISDACKAHPEGKKGIANAIDRDVLFINKLYDSGSVMQTYRIAKQIEELGL
jgi:hypothetical protein